MKRDDTNTGIEWAPTATGATAAGRTRAADFVFEELAGAILRGQLPAQKPLPPERDLATRFEISRVLVREAIHRLKDLGLVRVKQGGQTLVLDPDEATDPRVTVLALQLAPPDGVASRDFLERHLAHSVALLELAEYRMNLGEVAALEAVVAAYVRDGEEAGARFIGEFWPLVAKGTKNQILLRETKWWLTVATNVRLERALVPLAHEATVGLYEETTARLRRREGASTFFLGAVRPILHEPR